ncbi:MAG: hypothetical protein V2A77_00495 [Pseudomonadota bacterium]
MHDETGKRPGFAAVSLMVLVALTLFPSPGWAKMEKLVCSACHTMHNSQNGSPVVADGPLPHCLVNGCVGCHSNGGDGNEAGGAVIKEMGGNKVPVVWNINNPPEIVSGIEGPGLAGGNFYWVATGSPYAPPADEAAREAKKVGGDTNKGAIRARDRRGHNVLGISAKDSRLNVAPGGPPDLATLSACQGCHYDLTKDDDILGDEHPGGCRGCHVRPQHHEIAEGSDKWYRWLTSPHVDGDYDSVTMELIEGPPRHVVGWEDPDWGRFIGPFRHNEYSGVSNGETGARSMDRYCLGCHPKMSGAGGGNTAWKRHPSGVTVEHYRGRWGVDLTGLPLYDPQVPVARPWAKFEGASSVVKLGEDLVMCLSCHYAHGSQYRAMLRWPYFEEEVITPDSNGHLALPAPSPTAANCRTCHTMSFN